MEIINMGRETGRKTRRVSRQHTDIFPKLIDFWPKESCEYACVVPSEEVANNGPRGR
jgi:hypothetical protein